MHTDRAIHAIVDDDEDYAEIVLHGGGEFLAVHEKAAIARKADYRFVRERALRADGGRHAIAHRARGRGQLSAEFRNAQEAPNENIVIAGPRRDDEIVVQLFTQARERLAELHRAGDGRRVLGPRQIIGMRGLGRACPGDGVRRLHAFQLRAEGLRGRVDGKCGMIDAAEFVGVGMHMHEGLARRRNLEQRVTLRWHFRHATVHQQNEIGFLHTREKLWVRTDAEFARIIPVRVREQHGAAERCRDRQVEALGEAHEAVDRLRAPARAAENGDRRF